MAAIASAASAYYAYVQAGIASKALLATQRPWVSGDSFSLGSDLVFDQRGGHVTIAYTLKNVGNTVAIHVESGVQLIPYQLMAAIDDATNQAASVGWAKRSVPTPDLQFALTLTWAQRCALLPTLRLLRQRIFSE